MRKNLITMVLLYSFFLMAGSVYGIGEKTLSFGSSYTWEAMEKRQGVTEASSIRPDPVLVLASSSNVELTPASYKSGNRENRGAGSGLVDLYLSFDEGRSEYFTDSLGRYDISASSGLTAVTAPLTRGGSGAALFSGKDSLSLKPRNNALLASGSRVRDFSIEFWLYPRDMENGEQVLSLVSTRSGGQDGYIPQQVQCIISKNRLQWSFVNFFYSPGEETSKSLTLTGSPVLPRTWSHHLIRFDSDLGLLEYLVDGRVEALDYTTASGREGGEVYTPLIGEEPRLTLGERFSGIMDEFRIYRTYRDNPKLTKYPDSGGRVESRTLDLGNADSRILRIEAFGGWTTAAGGKLRNEYAGNGNLSFQDHSELRFSIRTSNSPYLWNGVPWIPVNPGTDLGDSFRGRYIQIAADFYPGMDGETSPYLAELRVIYDAADPPPPPTLLTATAKDGTVLLSWKPSPSMDVGGYMVYYGSSKGEYFGDNAVLGNAVWTSPIDVGNRTSIRLDGLNNGTLYYFAVAAYRKPETPNGQTLSFVPEPGEFSREVAARPLRMAE